jgi:putative endonuclease
MSNWKWYVYVLECLDGSFYIGMTWKPDIRFDQHESGLGGKYTGEHGIKRLAYLEEYDSLEVTRLREKQLKGWTREKKLKLIQEEWRKL